MVLFFLYNHIRRAIHNRGSQPQESTGKQQNTADASLSNTKPSPTSSWKYKIVLLASLGIPVFLETLDYTAVATAQTQIASVFNRLDLQSYIGTTYLLTSTVFLPLFACLADLYGRHTTLQISLVIYIIGAAVCTGSQSIITLFVGRAIAGIGSAGLSSCVRVIVMDAATIEENNSQGVLLTILYAAGYLIGPYLGGVLVEVNWRWVFGITLPACAVAIVVAFIFLRKYLQQDASDDVDTYGYYSNSKSLIARGLAKLQRIDWLGTALFVAGGILIILALNWGSTKGWGSAPVIVGFIVGTLLILVCLAWQYFLGHKTSHGSPSSSSGRTTVSQWPDQLLPLALFRSYDICAAQFASFVGGMVMLVVFYFLSEYLIIVVGRSPSDSGSELLFFAPGVGIGTQISIRFIRRFKQPKWLIFAGSVIIPIALGFISKGINENNQAFINGFMVLAGTGVGLSTRALAIQARFSVSSDHVSAVSGLTLFFRSLGGTVGLAQCSAVMYAKVSTQLHALQASGSLPASEAAALDKLVSSGGLTSLSSLGDLPTAVVTAIRDAYRDGVRWSFISMIPWAVLAALMSVGFSNITDSAGADADATGKSRLEERRLTQPSPELETVEMRTEAVHGGNNDRYEQQHV